MPELEQAYDPGMIQEYQNWEDIDSEPKTI